MAAAAAKPSTAPYEAADFVTPFRWIILIGLVTAAVMEVLDTTIVNVALPTMMGNLGATPDEIGWVSTGYILSNVVVLPMTAFLASRFGRKQYLVASILLFIISSFFCGNSHTLVELVFWRIVQGAGGAALLSTAQATLVEIFPRSMMGMVQAVFGLGMIVAPTLAPALGGYITDNWSWPWVFFINVPIGLFSAVIVGSFLVDAKYKRRADVIDWTGIGLLALGLGCLQYVLEEGNRWDWFEDANISHLAIIAGVALTVFVIWELSPRNEHPVVDLHVLKNRGLIASVVLSLCLGFGLYGGVFLYPLFVQGILHFTAVETGLALLPGGLASGCGMFFCGRILNSKHPVNPRILIAFGIVMFVISMGMMSRLTTLSGTDETQFALIIRGVGLGFLFLPITFAAFSAIAPKDVPQSSALLNLFRQLGGSFGIAVLTTYQTNMTRFHEAMLSQHLSPANPALMPRLSGIAQRLATHGITGPAAHSIANAVVANGLRAQAMTMAYDDSFHLLGLAMLIASPTIFLLRRARARPEATTETH